MQRAFSFGGGVQSTAALVLAAQGEIDFPVFLFSNVGEDSENPDTLDYVEQHAAPYAAEHGITLTTLRRQKRDGSHPTLYGELMDGSKRTINIPVRMANGAPGNRNCTENFKIKVISKWLKQNGASEQNPAVVGLGISLDEFHRARTSSGFDHYSLEYPLLDRRMDRSACFALIQRAGLPPPPKSSCWFCPYKRLQQWRDLKDQQPELFDKAVALEQHLNDRRASMGKDDIYLSSKAMPLNRVVGDEKQLSLFDSEDETCESGYCMV